MMKLHSPYLNPFQPFPERQSDGRSDERPGTAIESNMTRSVFSALANAADPCDAAMFLKALAPYGSEALRARAQDLAEVLRGTERSGVEWGLQSWPDAAMRERANLQVLLIGISCSHQTDWTHDQRYAPERCCADAWVYVPGKMLLVFECKNDDHPLDATQMSAYVHELKLLTEDGRVPRATTGMKLASPEEARCVKDACKDLVLDAPWDAVAEALRQIQRTQSVPTLGSWLCGEAAAYLEWHIYPPYRGVGTILEWLNGPDAPDRRKHLRRLVGRMGETLAKSAEGMEGAITFAQGENGTSELPSGGGSAVYVRLERGGEPVRVHWLGRNVDNVLWFDFADDEKPERIGLSFYVQANGAAPAQKFKSDWNRAKTRHLDCARQFEKTVEEWASRAPGSSRVIVGAVQFKGNSRMWRGGGDPALDGPYSSPLTPKEALEFLKTREAELWRFPSVGPGKDIATVNEAAKQVRKPAISLQIVLNASDLTECRMDGQALQEVLRKGINRLSAES